MKTSFGPFKREWKPPRNGDLSAHERALLKAFNKGAEAGRSDDLRRPPYLPSDAKFEAWLCGYDLQAPRYALAAATGTAKTPKSV
jgi:hypothetical protein